MGRRTISLMDDKRQKLISGLENRFTSFTSALVDELNARQFYFGEQRKAHLLNIDPELIVRHALPYCITEEAYFDLSDYGVQFLAAVILIHTLALTRIDDYYDGGNISKHGDALDVQALAYALSGTHEGIITLLKLAPKAKELVKMLGVTNFVHSRMYKDYTERYRYAYLESPEKRLQSYLYSPKSRLLGSGYWEVMARASFVQRGKAFPAYLHTVDINLRKFRQIIDELADIEEDLNGGLITAPVLYALSAHPYPELVKRSIIEHWTKGRDRATKRLLTQLIEETKVRNWVYEQAMIYYTGAMRELDSKLGKRGDGYRQLFEFKRAKLETLAAK
jgi:hypothetical protein